MWLYQQFFSDAQIDMQKLKLIQFGSQVWDDMMTGNILTHMNSNKDADIRQEVLFMAGDTQRINENVF